MRSAFGFIYLLCFGILAAAQNRYAPRIEPCDCRFRIDSSFLKAAPPLFQSQATFQLTVDTAFRTTCGYLIVPENRKKSTSRMIRLPYIILHSRNSKKKADPILFTSGGPGNSSLGWINGIANSSLVQDRDCIALEQRGTHFSIPYLRSFELDSAIRESYRKNLSKDSMWLQGVKRYKKALEKRGIDLSGYNTDETVSDIHDLLTSLRIDSVNLFGGSYSGGVMLAVLQKDSSRIRSLVLDSPLPTFAPIEEDEPAHFRQALSILFRHAQTDSADKGRYGNLEAAFEQYFRSISHQRFFLTYLEPGTKDSIKVGYTKNDLLDVLVSRLLNASTIKDVPYVLTEMIQGNHEPFIRPRLDRLFTRYTAPDGMRMLVYCADQAVYHDPARVEQLYRLYPYLRDYRINDVYKAVCDCWKNPAVKKSTKQPFYAAVPALIGDGEMDAACSPRYMLSLKHYLPNSQCFLFLKRGHGVGGKDFSELTQQFINHPYDRLVSKNPHVISY
jgi:pimeloyl-ACP methyl ester carboxylesterase